MRTLKSFAAMATLLVFALACGGGGGGGEGGSVAQGTTAGGRLKGSFKPADLYNIQDGDEFLIVELGSKSILLSKTTLTADQAQTIEISFDSTKNYALIVTRRGVRFLSTIILADQVRKALGTRDLDIGGINAATTYLTHLTDRALLAAPTVDSQTLVQSLLRDFFGGTVVAFNGLSMSRLNSSEVVKTERFYKEAANRINALTVFAEILSAYKRALNADESKALLALYDAILNVRDPEGWRGSATKVATLPSFPDSDAANPENSGRRIIQALVDNRRFFTDGVGLLSPGDLRELFWGGVGADLQLFQIAIETPTDLLTGGIIAENGAPVSGVNVSLKGSNDAGVNLGYQAVSNAEGVYEVRGLLVGRYEMGLKKGSNFFQLKNTEVVQGKTVINFDSFQLKDHVDGASIELGAGDKLQVKAGGISAEKFASALSYPGLLTVTGNTALATLLVSGPATFSANANIAGALISGDLTVRGRTSFNGNVFPASSGISGQVLSAGAGGNITWATIPPAADLTLSNLSDKSAARTNLGLAIGANVQAFDANIAKLNVAGNITADWVNTTNPWADNEVADNLTIVAGNISNTTVTGGSVTNAAISGGNVVSAAISGGNITNTPISGSTGSFTTLTVTGNTQLGDASADALTIIASLTGNALRFEGTNFDGNAMTLAVAEPGAGRTVLLRDVSGTVALTSDLAAIENFDANVAKLNVAGTITANWVNTANPWADNEVANDLTIAAGNISNTPITGGNITNAAIANTPISGSTGSFTTLTVSGLSTLASLTASGNGTFTGAVKVGNTSDTVAGTIRWDGTNFLGYDGAGWKTLDVQTFASGGGWSDDSGNAITFVTTASRNVGVGTTSPKDKLHVSGNILVDRSLVFEGTTVDTNKLSLTLADPTSSRTVAFKDESGTVALLTDLNGTRFSVTGNATGDLLTYDGTAWVRRARLDGTQFGVSGNTSGDLLSFDGTNWVRRARLDGTQFGVTGNTSGDLLTFDGTNWVRRARLDGTQFGVSGNTSGDLLTFDGTNWVRRARLDGTQFGVSGNTSGDLLTFDGTNWVRRARLDGTQFGVSGNTSGDLLTFDGTNWVRRARLDGTQFGVSGNATGDFLTFDGNNWVRTTGTVPADNSVNGDKIAVSGNVTGDMLVYDGNNWIRRARLDGTQFGVTGNTSGDLLTFDGTNWVRRARLDGTQFGVTGNTSGDLLTFDGTNWVRRARIDGSQLGVSGNATGDFLSFDGNNWVRTTGTVPADNSVNGDKIAVSGNVAGDMLVYDGNNWIRRARLDGTQFGVTGNASGDLLTFDGTNWVRRARLDGTQFGVSGNTSGDLLTFDGTNWVRRARLDGTQFGVTGNTSGDLLTFDGTNWVRRARLDGTQFGVSGNTSGDLLTFDGTNWVRRARLDGTQFGVTGNTSGDLLTFDGTNWVRRARLDGTQFGVSGNTSGDLLTFDGTNWVRRARLDGSQLGVSGNTTGDFLSFDGNNWVRTTGTVPADNSVNGDKIAVSGNVTGDMLVYDGNNWIRRARIDGTQFGVTGNTSGDLLSFDGTNWARRARLDGTQFGVAGNTSGDLLTFDGTNWVRRARLDGTQFGVSGNSTGDLLYFDGNNWVALGASGNAGKLLAMNSAGTSPQWTTTLTKDLTVSANLIVSGNGRFGEYLLLGQNSSAPSPVSGNGVLYNLSGNLFFKDPSNNLAQITSGNSTNLWTVSGSDIYRDSNVGVGTTLPTAKLEVSGNIVAAGNVLPSANLTYDLGSTSRAWRQVVTQDLVMISDARLKENVRELSYGLGEIMKLHPVTYTWKGDTRQQTKIGVLAQEVRAVMREAVSTGDDAAQTLGVRYVDLVPVLIHAVQEQQEIIESQKQALAEQERRISEALARQRAEIEEIKKKLDARR